MQSTTERGATWVERLEQWCVSVDRNLMAATPRMRWLVLGTTFAFMVLVRLWMMPAEFLDTGLNRTELVGMDYHADSYMGRVVANDPFDMYTKEGTEQTEREQRWSKAGASPYPPFSLLTMGAMHAVGSAVGVRYYWMTVGLELLFLGMALAYCLKTRWYVFVLMSAHIFLAFRVYWMANSSNIMVLTVAMAAMLLARRRPGAAHPVMAVAIAMKLTPVFYLTNLLRMRWAHRIGTVAILLVGLVLPFAVLDNYGYIWTRQAGRSTRQIVDAMASLGLEALTPLAIFLAYALPLAFVIGFSLRLLRVQTACDWDWEDRIGWALAPFALLFSLRVAAMRMFFLAMLLPDKRGTRSVFIAVMGALDMAMLAAGLQWNSAVRDVIWLVAGVALLVTFMKLWALQIRRSGREDEVDPRTLRGIRNLLTRPVPG